MRLLSVFLSGACCLLWSGCSTDRAESNPPPGAEPLPVVSREDTTPVNPDNSPFIFYEQDKLEQYLPREQLVFVVWDTLTDEPADLRQRQSVELRKADRRPPLFSRNCLRKTPPAQAACSYRAVQAYLDRLIQVPEPAVTPEERFIAYISVGIAKDGSVSPPIRLEDMRGERCGPCVDEAKRLIRDMPNWEPARYDGQPVATRVSIPVFYPQAYSTDANG